VEWEGPVLPLGWAGCLAYGTVWLFSGCLPGKTLSFSAAVSAISWAFSLASSKVFWEFLHLEDLARIDPILFIGLFTLF
jgi:hypothetical protein